MDLVRARHADFGPTFAREKLVEVHGLSLSAETPRKWMVEDGLRRVRPRGGPPARLVVEEERRNEVLPLAQLLLLDRLWRADAIDVAAAATLTQRSERDAAEALESLARRGLCGGEGAGERRRWRLATTRQA